ncbi:unnamed protein product, partial [Iphiclides podalirius]
MFGVGKVIELYEIKHIFTEQNSGGPSSVAPRRDIVLGGQNCRESKRYRPEGFRPSGESVVPDARSSRFPYT